jgi:hypothetical protein
VSGRRRPAILNSQDPVTFTMKKATSTSGRSKNRSKAGEADLPSRSIDARVREPSDWRSDTLARVRVLIQQADPDAVEEVKWRKPSNAMRGVAVWSHAGILCTGETYKDKVKLTFARGASLEDRSGLFNSSLEGSTRRAIDLHEGDRIDEQAFQELVRAAVALNTVAPGASGRVPSRRRVTRR